MEALNLVIRSSELPPLPKGLIGLKVAHYLSEFNLPVRSGVGELPTLKALINKGFHLLTQNFQQTLKLQKICSAHRSKTYIYGKHIKLTICLTRSLLCSYYRNFNRAFNIFNFRWHFNKTDSKTLSHKPATLETKQNPDHEL